MGHAYRFRLTINFYTLNTTKYGLNPSFSINCRAVPPSRGPELSGKAGPAHARRLHISSHWRSSRMAHADPLRGSQETTHRFDHEMADPGAGRGGGPGSGRRDCRPQNVRVAPHGGLIDPHRPTDAPNPEFRHVGSIDRRGPDVFAMCPGLMIADIDPRLDARQAVPPNGRPPRKPTNRTPPDRT
jgi:hypothetical protein